MNETNLVETSLFFIFNILEEEIKPDALWGTLFAKDRISKYKVKFLIVSVNNVWIK